MVGKGDLGLHGRPPFRLLERALRLSRADRNLPNALGVQADRVRSPYNAVMCRSLYLLALGVLVAPAFASHAETPAQTTPRPNILLLFADDQRTDTISAWGNPHIRTPNLDALVERGMSFRRTYCLGSPHGAVCVPSRAMLFTGRSYHQIDIGSLAGCRTLGEGLRAAGYRAFGTGKWHNSRAAFARSFDLGRNVMFGGMSDHRQVPVVDYLDASYSDGRSGELHSSELFAESAIDFLDSYGEDAPFFCYVAFTAPHDPRDPPRPWGQRYYADPPPLPSNFLPQQPWDIGMMTVRDEVLAGWPREPQVVRAQLAEYYGLIEHMDHQIGRILARLAARDDADNTIVVFAADHGLAVGSHGLLGKQSVFEHSLRAPLIVSGPGVPEGTATTALTYLNDLYPTLLGMAGAQGDTEGVLGRDLRPLMRGETEAVRESVLLCMGNTQRAVSDGRWKLIRYPQIDRWRLFDLASDPHELVNLIDRPEQAGRIESLTAKLREWQARAGDELALEGHEVQPAEVDLTNHKRSPDHWQPRWIRAKYFGEE